MSDMDDLYGSPQDETPSKLTRKEVAEARIMVALDEIQKAQYALDAACRAISPIYGLAPMHRRIGKLSDRVKAAWYALDHKTAALRRSSNDTPSIDRKPDEQYDDEYVRKAGGRRAFGDALP